MSYDTLRVVVSCLAATLTLSGDHIITSAKHSHNVWRSQIHNSKLITESKEFVMADSVLRAKSKEFAKGIVFLCRNLKHNGVESALINQLLRCGHLLVQTFTKHSMPKEQRTSSQNLKLHSKNVTRVNIGLNCFLKRILWQRRILKGFTANVLNFVACSFQLLLR